jgi:thiol-disulfide isomerase/thioredoxin
MLALGTPCSNFRLEDAVTGREMARDEFAENAALVVAFICNHCPFVKHIREGLAAFGRDYAARGLAIVAINSNDAERYPDDAPPRMAEEAASAGYTFPYLFDEDQQVAVAFRAACTPDFFLFDRDRKLVYRGQFDGSRPGNDIPVTGADLRAAADAVLASRPVPLEQQPSIGCNIKWKPGNAPGYAS